MFDMQQASMFAMQQASMFDVQQTSMFGMPDSSEGGFLTPAPYSLPMTSPTYQQGITIQPGFMSEFLMNNAPLRIGDAHVDRQVQPFPLPQSLSGEADDRHQGHQGGHRGKGKAVADKRVRKSKTCYICPGWHWPEGGQRVVHGSCPEHGPPQWPPEWQQQEENNDEDD